ncbi:MAG: 1-acyl-sn-glycerol-3-phosphate acyltransferase [Micavibrio aeruginosavorus]|uniref:1-acyl-sn-glycerol-3-phosphate acyltransferase n=1 Tax=Micavibrio aeruginosavorus TaxID=349221 RepID=A0A7T5R0A7_9BACT|nr:MAG: 1-acyl-sn-glycerol-3-phosphate acyltransferase [Micavibrio aeruginosavorus]
MMPLKLGGFLIWCLIMVPVQLVIMLFKGRKPAYTTPWLWHKGVCRLFGLTVQIEGAPHTGSQVIFVCNHMSYLDIPVIGSVLKASFVAKSEVASWPVFGFLSKLQQTAFISRSKTTLGNDKNALETMLKDGRSMIIFPEGTSTDGRSVVPFKSSLFSIALSEDALAQDIWLQPMTLCLIAVDRQNPEDQKIRDLYAWHGEMDLAPHLSAFTRTRGATIKITFHPPIQARALPDRKKLAQICHEHVARGLTTQGLAFAA